MNDLLRQYYERHHISGNRLRQSFLEDARGPLFAGWIGIGKTILDLGCRDGTLTRHYSQNNHIIGGDIDLSALQYAQENYGVAIQHLDLNAHLPFDNHQFDVVVMAEVLEHLPYPASTLEEVRRVLKPHGAFIGSVPLAYFLKDRYRVLRGKKLIVAGDPTHLQYFSYDDIVALLSRNFEVAEIEILKGGRWASWSRRLFARNIAFRCVVTAG
jgi:SAM-dependent methyltransferase